MTSRERVLCTLEHEEPDRVPIFFGTSGVTTMLASAYDRLKSSLGLGGETEVFWRALQYAVLDEDVMRRFGSDGRMLAPGPAPSANERELEGDAFTDSWGISWRRPPEGAYYEISAPPLHDAGISDIDTHPWPDLSHPSRFEGLGIRARKIRDAGYATVGLSGITPFEFCCMLRGMEAFMIDLAADPDFARALLRRVTDLQLAAAEALLAEAGECIDVLVTGDDLASQEAPLISPSMYREIVKPFHAELMSAVKKRTKAKIFYHSCGNVGPLIDDLVEIGVDILNPVQVSARGLGDTAALKRRYGKRLSFCGGVDSQRILPHGTTDEVREEVRRRIGDLGPGGGYILAAVHCIQPDVPPENVRAMFEEAMSAGRYPLHTGGRP